MADAGHIAETAGLDVQQRVSAPVRQSLSFGG
jgi:hypothetical protein